MTEEWRPVPGFEGRYEVSSEGGVRSLGWMTNHRWGGRVMRKGRRLKPMLGERGYWTVCLRSETSVKRVFVHRLVAAAFIPERAGGEVNHKDFNPQNNRVGNLEWASRQENIRHSVAHGRFSGFHSVRRRIKLTPESVVAIRDMARQGLGLGAINSKFGISKSMASLVARGLAWREVPAS